MDKYENYNRVISDLDGYYLPEENILDLLTYGFCYNIVMVPSKYSIELSGEEIILTKEEYVMLYEYLLNQIELLYKSL